jgi:hypothetical protein
MKKYRLGFSIRGFLSFLLIMIPNIIWMIISPANDLLAENSSVYPILDVTEHVSQGIMLALLFVIINNERSNGRRARIYLSISGICISIYYILWILYYIGIVDPWMLLGLAFFPAVYFLCMALTLRNYLMLIPCVIFGIIHIIITGMNFL